MAPTTEQARIVAALKAGAPPEVSLPIRRGTAEIGALTPVTHDLGRDPEIISALCRWRQEHMGCFLTVFAPSLEKTRGYLNDFSLPDSARVLFLIADHDHRYVGHIGLCNIAEDSAEIDNVIRGEPVGTPDFMVRAHDVLLDWTFWSLGVPLVYLNVLAHNARAIRSYEKAGLRTVSRTPLARQDIDGGYKLVPAPRAVPHGGATLLRMEIRRDDFDRGRTVGRSG